MSYQEILKRVSKELNLPLKVVKKAYESYWLFIRQSITDLPLREDLSEEDFNKLRSNFNIPSLGKLTCTYERMKGVKERFKYINRIRNESNKES